MTTTFEVLAEPTRRRILELLREKPRLVGELAEILNLRQPGVSKHLRILREAGLVRVRQDAQRHWYDVNPDPLMEMEAWLEPFRRMREAQFDRLEALLNELQAKEQDNGET